MGNRRGHLTEVEIEARRENAQKSTGPRTEAGKRRSRLNALKHGVRSRAQTFYETMADLGEDPDEFARLLRGLVAACQPADALETMLVEDIAILQWKKARLDRAQAGVQARSLQALVAERRVQALQVGRDTPNVSQAEALKVGLRRVSNSPAKFQEILSALDVLLEWTKEEKFTPDAEELLRALYGEEPSLRGAQIINLFRQLAEPGEGTSERESLGAGLHLVLLEESRDVTEEYQLHLQEHVQISRAQRDAALAPTPSEWHVMIRHENALHRQIDQKLKLLGGIQKRRLEEQERLLRMRDLSLEDHRKNL